MKKLTFLLVLIFLFVSLIFNGYQYRVINSYKEKQHFNDVELKANIGQLNFYLDKIDFETLNEKNARDCLSMSERIFTLVRNSTYSSDRDVVDCFNDLDNVFTGAPIDKIKSIGEQVRVLLKSTIDMKSNEINPEECKKLSEFIRSNL